MNTRTLLNGFDIGLQTSGLTKASDVKIKKTKKYHFSQHGLNKIFGDGVIKGSVFTFSAERGCGKTTFLLQCLQDFKSKNKRQRVAFISNEESQEQLAEKCIRIQTRDIDIAYSSDLEFILNTVEQYDLVVIDSLQGIKGANQKAIASNIVSVAKKFKCCVGMITHRTKNNKEKGDSSITHIVDACFHMKIIETNLTPLKKVCVYTDKNRFGQLGYVVTVMTDVGFEMYLTDLFFENYTDTVLKEIF